MRDFTFKGEGELLRGGVEHAESLAVLPEIPAVCEKEPVRYRPCRLSAYPEVPGCHTVVAYPESVAVPVFRHWREKRETDGPAVVCPAGLVFAVDEVLVVATEYCFPIVRIVMART